MTELSAQPGEADREALVESLRQAITEHISGLALDAPDLGESRTKSAVRLSHESHRRDVFAKERLRLQREWLRLSEWFAVGREIDPTKIKPGLVAVDPEKDTGLVFRLATLLWSVPVSRGFGRRMRYLVIDEQNGKLIGLFALGDPVFNLRVRDAFVGWTVDQRRDRLVGVLDAFAVGAVPPYSGLLGGKLVASLMASDEVSRDFDRRYANTTGIISKEPKEAHLAMITVTSALGRSSLYNRVSLPGLVKLQRLGNTEGWGHFHVPDPVFADMRRLLKMDGHKYAAGYRYGQGPNWRLRVIRESLSRLGMSPAILRHGISREVFAMPLANNWRPYLLGDVDTLDANHATTASLSDAAMSRWVLPRAKRCPEALSWTNADRTALFQPMFQSPQVQAGQGMSTGSGDAITLWEEGDPG